jgi:hypothetical protein
VTPGIRLAGNTLAGALAWLRRNYEIEELGLGAEMGYLFFALAIIAALFFYWLWFYHRVLYRASEVAVG